MSEIKENLTFYQKIIKTIKNISVEPLIFFYILPGAMGMLTTQNLNLEKACRVNLAYNETICDGMLNRNKSLYEDYQEENVQKLVSKMLMIKTIFVGLVPAALLLFYGSWSDRNERRKPLILIPIVCDILSGIGLIIGSIFLLEIPLELVTLVDIFPFVIGGGWSCVFLGVFSYITSITKDKEKTFKIGIVSMVQNIAITIGNITGGLVLNKFGITYSYITVNLLMVFSLIYGYFMIKETKINKKTNKNKNIVKDFLNVKHIKQTFKICFENKNRKWKTLILMFSTCLITGPVQGEINVIYLYTRKKFGWNEVNFSIFNTIQFVLQLLGSMFALSILSKKFKFDDATLGIIGLISKILATFIYALAPNGNYFFIGGFIELFYGSCHISLRAIMNKIVEPQELGQTNSVFGVCEALMPFIFGPLYTILYKLTIKTFPGAFYFITATLYLINLPLFIWLYKNNKKHQKDIKNVKEEEILMKEIKYSKIIDERTIYSVDER